MLHSTFALLAAASNSDTKLAPSGSPTIFSYLLTGLVSLAVLVLADQYRRQGEYKKEMAQRLDKQDESLALVNQALAVLVSQVSPITALLDSHSQKLSALETSNALLKQALEIHIQSEVRKGNLKLPDQKE